MVKCMILYGVSMVYVIISQPGGHSDKSARGGGGGWSLNQK